MVIDNNLRSSDIIKYENDENHTCQKEGFEVRGLRFKPLIRIKL